MKTFGEVHEKWGRNALYCYYLGPTFNTIILMTKRKRVLTYLLFELFRNRVLERLPWLQTLT